VSFPGLILTCVSDAYANEFSHWLSEKGWIHDAKGSTVTVTGSHAGFAVGIVDEAISHGWATSAAGVDALVAYGAALHSDQGN